VRNLRFESREQAYAEFVRLWKDSPDFVAAVGPDALPESFRMDLAEPSGYPKLAAAFGHRPGVQDLIGQPCSRVRR
jgi:cell division protein FtsX